MRVGVVFVVPKAFVKLRDRIFQKQQKIVLHVRVGVLIDRQTARRMLCEQNANPFARFGNKLFNFARDLDQFFALFRLNFYRLHKRKFTTENTQRTEPNLRWKVKLFSPGRKMFVLEF